MVVKEIPYFDLSEICDSGQCFRMERITENEFQIRAEDKYLRATQEGETVRFDCSEEEFETFWKYYFDLERDYGIYIEAIDPEDTYLKTAAELGSGIRILNQDLWEMIVSFLISQQNNIFRIRKCIDRISRRYGEEKRAADGTVYHAFPTAEALSQATEEELRDCNLGYRAKYVRDTALRVASGEVDLAVIRKMTYPEARASEALRRRRESGGLHLPYGPSRAFGVSSGYPYPPGPGKALSRRFPGEAVWGNGRCAPTVHFLL